MSVQSGDPDRTSSSPTIRAVGRPEPRSYFLAAGDGDGLLPWSFAEDRLVVSRNYWVATASLEGRPHAMPVWGIWLDGELQFSTGMQTRKARNLAENPRASMHLEDGDAAVIIEGTVRVDQGEATLKRFAELYNRKYSWDFTVERLVEDGGVFILRPAKAFAWKGSEGDSFGGAATRWTFEQA